MEIIVAIIAAVGVIGGAAAPTLIQRKKVNETHRMVTVNHHSSREQGKPDTVLDHLTDLKELVSAQGSLLAEHIKHAEIRDVVTDNRFERIEHVLDLKE